MKRKFSVVLACLLVVQAIWLPGWYGFTNEKMHAQGQEEDGVKINFQPAESDVPEGYVPDYGEPYGDRNGHTYGWNHDLTDQTVTRSTYGQDPLHTYIRLSDPNVWEIQMDNGEYEVAVTVGDAVYGTQNTVYVEGTAFFEQESLGPGQHETVKKSVRIEDGRLTLDKGGVEDGLTALNTVEIQRIVSVPDADEITPPTIGPPPESRNQTGDKVLLSGNMNNIHSAPPYLHVDGLEEAIRDYMDERIGNLEQTISDLSDTAVTCAHCDADDLEQMAEDQDASPLVIETGHLNLNENLELGSEERPVVLVADGINTNGDIRIEIVGSLIVRGNLNGNREISIQVQAPSDTAYPLDGNFWVQGQFHLNRDANVQVEGEWYAERLIYNNGTHSIGAGRLIVRDQLHFNTDTHVEVKEQIALGGLVSNNGSVDLNVAEGDLFVRDNVNVNNNLTVTTGGWFAVGGNMTANQRPEIRTGAGPEGETLLKYTLHGLLADYYSGNDFSGQHYQTVDREIHLNKDPDLPVSGITDGHFSVRWTGQIQPRYSETYQFEVNTRGGVRLWIDGELLIDAWNGQPNLEQASVDLQAGRRYDFRLEYAKSENNARAELYWQSASQAKEIIPGTRLYPFAVPDDLNTSATEESLTLTWDPVFNVGTYEVEVDGEIISIGDEPVYVHDQLLSGTEHQYRVRPVSGDITGSWSEMLTSWTLPGVPQGFELSSTSDSIRLEWEPVRGATGYEVEMNEIITDIGNVTEFEIHDINPNVQRTFRVRAKNASGPGRWSDVLVQTTRVDVPKNLAAEAADTSIRITWDPVSGAESYDLEIDGNRIEDWEETTYLHEGLMPNTLHTYRVKAKNENGASEWSEEIRVMTLPTTPVAVIESVTNDEIVVSWNPVSDATGYEVEADGRIFDNAGNTSFIHEGLASNSEHTYRVRTRVGETVSEWSEPVSAMTRPDTPKNVRTDPGTTWIRVVWDPVAGASGYEVEADGTVIQNGLNTEFRHESLQPNTKHTYRVRAKNAGGSGAWSQPVSVFTLFGTPELTVAGRTAHSISLSWDAVDGAESYELMVDGELIHVGTATSFVHKDLEPYTYHVYRLRAKGSEMDGEWSPALTTPTLLGTPTHIRSNSGSSSITIRWEEVRGADYYQVEVDGTIVETEEAVYVHSGLSANSRHAYRVRAVNAEVTGEWSRLVEERTAPAVPEPEVTAVTTDSITLSWEKVPGASEYDVEVDGNLISGVDGETYTHHGFEANTMHRFRVRARSGGGTGNWSDPIVRNTVPELTINVGKDNIFNFVAVAPEKVGVSTRTMIVTYDPDDVEVLDLNAMTPEKNLSAGPIEGTDMQVTEFVPGRIVYRIENAERTVVNSIQFMAKTNEFSQITYTIE